MYDFEYVKAGSIDEAVKALGGDEAMPLAGGQTLLPTLRQRLNQPSRLVDLTAIEEMRKIAPEGDKVRIGASATHFAISQELKEVFPALAYLAGRIGDPAVRHRGTIGGSVANNDPAACYPAACLATGATIHTSGGDVLADEFFEGMFTTTLGEGQIVTGVTFPIPQTASYQKFEQPASRFPLVGVFVARFADGVRVGVTGASEGGVFRWTEAEAKLSSDFSPGALKGMKPPAEGMIGDIHGSPEYRAHITGVMTRRGVAEAS